MSSLQCAPKGGEILNIQGEVLALLFLLRTNVYIIVKESIHLKYL
jgi:hypothetical protein